MVYQWNHSLRGGSAAVRNAPAGTAGVHLLSEAALPAISPDGTKLAFQRIDDSNGYDDTDIWLSNIDGSNAHPFAGNPASDDIRPTFSPSGSEIAFISRRPWIAWNTIGCRFENLDGAYNLYRAPLSGSTVERLTGDLDNFGADMTPSWR